MSDLKADTAIACMFVGDARTMIARMPSGSVQCCVTSPPYYGLRDYGTAQWEGGDPTCDHAFVPDAGRTSVRLGATYQQGHPHRNCRCGARRIDQQIGLEQTPDEYVSTIVDIFRDVWRVLRDDGTLWLNIGDSYARPDRERPPQTIAPLLDYGTCRSHIPEGLKAKDLIGIPWRVAFALQADGWYLRSAIVWHKPNPMPESVTDRPTSAYEMVFLLTKSDRYFYDAEAIKELSVGSHARGANATPIPDRPDTHGLNGHGAWGDAHYANRRNVWSISPTPFPGAHFATMPVELAARCILAGTSERGCCAKCGAPWLRQTGKGAPDLDWQRKSGGNTFGEYFGQSIKGHDAAGVQNASDVKRRILEGMVETVTLGWQPTCQCDAPTQPCTVLDPFGGSGTTALAAMQNNRDAWLIDLKPDYVDDLSYQRLKYAALPITLQELGEILRHRRTLQRLCARNDMSAARLYARGPVQLNITELLMPRHQPQLKITELFGHA